MRLSYQGAGLLLISAAVAVAMAYAIVDRRGETPASAPLPRLTAPAPATAPLAAAPSDSAQTSAGKSDADPASAYTQYRIGNAAVRTIHADGHLLWVGTSNGLVRYDTAKGEHRFLDASDGLRSNAVLYVGRHEDKLVLGMHGGGLALSDAQKERWELYGLADGLPDARVFNAMKASNGDLWIATWAGVLRVGTGMLRNGSQWQRYTVADTQGGLPSDRVYGIAEARNGALWFATEGGVARYQRGKWSNWKGESGPAAAHTVSLAVGADGAVWAGTWGAGLGRFDGKRWRSYGTADGLPGDRVFTLHHDAEGRLWIGTDKGLARFADGRFRVLGTADGLVSNAVFAIATPADGTLWVGGNGGVAHIRRYALRSSR